MGLSKYILCPEWALSLVSVNALLRLDYMNIPFPVCSPFVPYSVTNVAGNKLAVGDGLPSCTWEYSEAGIERVAWMQFNRFLNGAASAFVYLRTTNNTDTGFANYYGVMRMPPLTPVGYNIQAYEPLTISFTALVAQ